MAKWWNNVKRVNESKNGKRFLDSFDMAKLEIQFNPEPLPSESLQFPITTMYIGAWWNVYTFELDITYTNNNWLTLICKDKRVQIAKCDVVAVD